MKTILKQHRRATAILEDGNLSASLNIRISNAADRKNALEFCTVITTEVKRVEKEKAKAKKISDKKKASAVQSVA